jgi:ribosomal protein L20
MTLTPPANASPGGNRSVRGNETGAIPAERQTAHRTRKRKTTMKEKPNYAELEKRVDFTALAGRIGQLTEQDNPQRKTVFTLLDKVREQILAARRNHNVSYQVLAKELTSAGIPVSEPTLRKYIRAQGVATKPRKKVAPKTGNGDGRPAAAAASAETKPATPTRTHRFNLTV